MIEQFDDEFKSVGYADDWKASRWKQEADWGNVWSKVVGWVMALRAGWGSPRNSLCHDTAFGFAGSDAGFGSAVTV